MNNEEPSGDEDWPPVALGFTYSHGDAVTDITLGMSGGAVGTVNIRPRGSGLTVSGYFRKDGTLEAVQINAAAGHEITATDLRQLSSVRMLKEWDLVARELRRQIDEGTYKQDTKVDAAPAAEMLRALNARRSTRTQGKRKRGAEAEAVLEEIVAAYREALAVNDPKPRMTLAKRFGYSAEHIGYLLSQARKSRNGKPPLLGPAAPGKAGEVTDDAR